ncbi:response regulator [Salinisphaera sp.]|uniref:response regulator transcription factor n=1 Tax=Salinisphaera sp. TaxID=1914330 RepID=UPI000C45D51E|nr:response regulator [Salinisphaera sp.]MBS61365.1 DNA-binding response regulator [Salinisphaera sp.]
MNETIYVVEDDDAIRESLKGLASDAGYAVRCFRSAERFLGHAPRIDAGCALVDMRLPGMDGLQLQRRISAAGLGVRTVFITGYATIRLAVEAMQLGASGFLTKPARAEQLLAEIERCLRRGKRQRGRHEAGRAYARQLERLTPREAETANGLANGLTTRQVALALGISKRTAESHRANIMAKLYITSVATLTKMVCLAASDHQLPAHGATAGKRPPDCRP